MLFYSTEPTDDGDFGLWDTAYPISQHSLIILHCAFKELGTTWNLCQQQMQQ